VVLQCYEPFPKAQILALEEELTACVTVGANYSVLANMEAEVLCFELLLRR
jgi:hypothetical protein